MCVDGKGDSLVKNPSAVYLRSVEKNSIPGFSLAFFGCVFVEGCEIEHFCPLPPSTLQVGLPVPLHTGRVRPHDPAPELKLKIFVLAGGRINEFGRARFYRASDFLVERNDRMEPCSRRFVLMLMFARECGTRWENSGAYSPEDDAALCALTMR